MLVLIDSQDDGSTDVSSTYISIVEVGNCKVACTCSTSVVVCKHDHNGTDKDVVTTYLTCT